MKTTHFFVDLFLRPENRSVWNWAGIENQYKIGKHRIKEVVYSNGKHVFSDDELKLLNSFYKSICGCV